VIETVSPENQRCLNGYTIRFLIVGHKAEPLQIYDRLLEHINHFFVKPIEFLSINILIGRHNHHEDLIGPGTLPHNQIPPKPTLIKPIKGLQLRLPSYKLFEHCCNNLRPFGANSDFSGILNHNGSILEIPLIESNRHLAIAIVSDCELGFVSVFGSLASARDEVCEF
jgi:hypothetical protein